MSVASDLIERMERETGQRIDDENSVAMAGLFGAIARIIGQSSHQEYDDVVAGVVIQHRMTTEYKHEQESHAVLASLLQSGLSPEDVHSWIATSDEI